jgi:hypothetical protein
VNEVIAHIDISTPTGRRIVNELQKHRKSVRMEYPESEIIAEQKWHTIKDVFGEVEKKLNDHYGSHLHLKY